MTLLTKIRFQRQGLIGICWTLLGESMIFIMFSNTIVPIWLMCTCMIVGFIPAVYYITKTMLLYSERVRTYKKLHALYSKNPENIRKTLLYEMRESKCDRQIVFQLQRDFNIELATN